MGSVDQVYGKNIENGNVIGNVDFLIFNGFYNSYFFPYLFNI